MKKAMLLDHLALADHHIERGKQIIARQGEIVRELARGGHDATSAVDLLQLFEQLQALHVADRDRLRWELKAIDQFETMRAATPAGSSGCRHLNDR